MISFGALTKNLKKPLPEGLKPVRVALLGDTATQFLAQAIRGMGLEYGLGIELWEAEFNQIDRELFDPASEYHQRGSDITVLFEASNALLRKQIRGGVFRSCGAAD